MPLEINEEGGYLFFYFKNRLQLVTYIYVIKIEKRFIIFYSERLLRSER